MPASTSPSMPVFLAWASVFADPEIAFGKTNLIEPGQRPAGVGVEIALLLGQRLVEGLVDQRQRGAHRNRLAFGVEHLGVAGIDRHAGADGGLREVNRRDVAGLQMRQGLRQFGLERGDELTAGGGGRSWWNVGDRRGRCWKQEHWCLSQSCGYSIRSASAKFR